MREDAIEDVLLSEMRKRGGMSFKIVPVVAGLPDRMVVWPWGVVELVELKTTTGDLRPAQRVMHRRLAKRGVTVPVLYGSEEVRTWVRARIQPNGDQNG